MNKKIKRKDKNVKINFLISQINKLLNIILFNVNNFKIKKIRQLKNKQKKFRKEKNNMKTEQNFKKIICRKELFM